MESFLHDRGLLLFDVRIEKLRTQLHVHVRVTEEDLGFVSLALLDLFTLPETVRITRLEIFTRNNYVTIH
jgi:hypothetical protein